MTTEKIQLGSKHFASVDASNVPDEFKVFSTLGVSLDFKGCNLWIVSPANATGERYYSPVDVENAVVTKTGRFDSESAVLGHFVAMSLKDAIRNTANRIEKELTEDEARKRIAKLASSKIAGLDKATIKALLEEEGLI